MKTKWEDYYFLSLEAKGLWIFFCLIAFVAFCFLAGLRPPSWLRISLPCWTIRKIPRSSLTNITTLRNMPPVFYLFPNQIGCRSLDSPPIQLHSAGELAQAVTNNLRLTLIVLISLSIPHLRVSHYCSSLFGEPEIHLGKGSILGGPFPLDFQTQ